MTVAVANEAAGCLVRPSALAAGSVRQSRAGRTRVFGLISNGVLASVKIGRSRRIRRRALEAYVASLDVAP